MSTTPYAFIKHGNLFIAPVGSSINEVPYPPQSVTKPREFSLWVHGKVEEPEFQLDKARMPPSMYQEVRKDLSKYSSVPVSRSAFRRSQHAYVGVIDSRGKPYYFALDSRGFSCREASINDDRVWKTFDHLAGEEQLMAIKQRRQHADEEMEQVDRELSKPLLILKSDFDWKRKTKERVGDKKSPIEKDMTAGGSPQPMKPRVVGKQATEAQQPSLATRLVAVRGDYARRTGDNSIFPSSRKPVAAMDYSKMTKPPVVAKKSIEPALVLMIEKALPKKSKEHASAARLSFEAHQASDRAHSFRYAHSPPYAHSHEHAHDAHRAAARALSALGKHSQAQRHEEHAEWHRKLVNQRRKNFQEERRATGYTGGNTADGHVEPYDVHTGDSGVKKGARRPYGRSRQRRAAPDAHPR